MFFSSCALFCALDFVVCFLLIFLLLLLLFLNILVIVDEIMLDSVLLALYYLAMKVWTGFYFFSLELPIIVTKFHVGGWSL